MSCGKCGSTYRGSIQRSRKTDERDSSFFRIPRDSPTGPTRTLPPAPDVTPLRPRAVRCSSLILPPRLQILDELTTPSYHQIYHQVRYTYTIPGLSKTPYIQTITRYNPRRERHDLRADYYE